MNTANLPLAKVGYDGFWAGFFFPHTFSVLFLTAGLAAFMTAIYRVDRYSPLHTKVRSASVLMCCLPFVFCSAAALCDLWRLQWDWRSYYPSPWASNSFHLALFGAALSTIAVVFCVHERARNSRLLRK